MYVGNLHNISFNDVASGGGLSCLIELLGVYEKHEPTEIQKRIENTVTNGLGYKDNNLFNLVKFDTFMNNNFKDEFSENDLYMHILEMDVRIKPDKEASEIIEDYKKLEAKIYRYELHKKVDELVTNFSLDRGCSRKEDACYGISIENLTPEKQKFKPLKFYGGNSLESLKDYFAYGNNNPKGAGAA